MKERFPEIAALSLDEKRELMDELWEEVYGSETGQPDPATVALLKERWEQYEADPSTAITLEEFRKRLPTA
jgi:putative addiction module component (TIGR02574 family)